MYNSNPNTIQHHGEISRTNWAPLCPVMILLGKIQKVEETVNYILVKLPFLMEDDSEEEDG